MNNAAMQQCNNVGSMMNSVCELGGFLAIDFAMKVLFELHFLFIVTDMFMN
jgi:hypothetical protein